jgi:hypothetical protein
MVHTDNHMDPFAKDHFAAEVLVKNLAQSLKLASKAKSQKQGGRRSTVEPAVSKGQIHVRPQSRDNSAAVVQARRCTDSTM